MSLPERESTQTSASRAEPACSLLPEIGNLRHLEARCTRGATVQALGPGHWRLGLPAGPGGIYRQSQLDDYWRLPRRAFPWRPPLTLRLRARVSHHEMPGTWGFGFWNDPFSARLGLGGAARRLPTLPDAAWFFYASPPNYLALRDDHPAQGLLAATFRSAPLPVWALAPAFPAMGLLAWQPFARRVRRLARHVVGEDAALVDVDPTDWHEYELVWEPHRVRLAADGATCLETAASPRPPLGLVLWIDNQYAAWTPTGRLETGNLPFNEPAWLEMDNIELQVLGGE